MQDIINQYKNDIRSKEVYPVKQSKIQEDNVLILKRSTAESLIKQGLLRRPDDVKDPNFANVHALKALRNTDKDTVLLLSRHDTNTENKQPLKTLKAITINGMTCKVQHDDPAWFGYAPDFNFDAIVAVMSDEIFTKIPVQETNMATVQFQKNYGTLRDGGMGLSESDTDVQQKNTEWLRLTKTIQKYAKYVKDISFSKK
ncbi:hypothetical protein BN2127_JRS10_04260 [Bacillus subtilis]|nr:hypothetical protein BN2127_JRS10_04260 [Bacillus subtilis]